MKASWRDFSLTDNLTSGSTESIDLTARQSMSSSIHNETEGEKRKRAGNDDVSACTKKARDDGREKKSVTEEEEVEEFFAILRRIHDAVKYYEKDKGDGRKLTEEKSRSRVLLEKGCGEEDNGVKGEVKRGDGEEKNVGFDLNANPSTEENWI